MFQEFYTDTLISRFIKRLLRVTKLPLLSLADDSSYIISGCNYLYKDKVINCITSSYIDMGNYEIIGNHSSFNSDNTYNYHSKVMYYDSDTHMQLGEYLRYLKHQTGLNLMPFYNCYANKIIQDVQLIKNDRSKYILKTSPSYKLYSISVKYGKTYTIALDCDSPVCFKTIIYNSDCGMVTYSINNQDSDQDIYYTDLLKDDYLVKPNTQFTRPFTIDITNLSSEGKSEIELKALKEQENNLYLIIQVPKSNNSSIAVLEGDFTRSWRYPISNLPDASFPLTDSAKFRNLSLLQMNTNKSYAFSNRLVEYLLHNNINRLEAIAENISYVQDLINNPIDKKLNWTDDFEKYLAIEGNTLLESNFLIDLDGNLNSDIEKLLLQKYKRS